MMISRNRFVADTNVIISYLLQPTSTPGRAFRKALSTKKLLTSEEVLQELIEVLDRKKFDSYLTVEDKQSFLHQLSFVVEVISHTIPIRACRDPNDDKFLSLAISGSANLLLTGDKDLLVLDPFENVRILTCSTYLQEDFSFEETENKHRIKLVN